MPTKGVSIGRAVAAYSFVAVHGTVPTRFKALLHGNKLKSINSVIVAEVTDL